MLSVGRLYFVGLPLTLLTAFTVAAGADTSSPAPAKADNAATFWSLQPVTDPAPPQVKDSAWASTPLDRFVLASLESHGLAPVKPAEKGALLRRATFDLTGLPPTPPEIEAFLADNDPSAYAKVVDRLLASPAYGERWGRHWLDLVRYADTAGEAADFPVPDAWRYRNWVIDSFNADEPYDQFVREQIAGDLIAPANSPEKYEKAITATGYLAISRRFGYDSENYMHLTFQDTLDNIGQTMLGLSIGCARCHDHKFDPIPTADYYSLYGILASTNFAAPGCEKHPQASDFIPAIPPEQARAAKAAFDAEISLLDSEIGKTKLGKLAVAAEMKAATVPAPVAGAAPVPSPAAPSPQGVALLKAVVAAMDQSQLQAQQKKAALMAKGPYRLLYGVCEGAAHNEKIQKRGEPKKLGDEVPRHWLTVLGGDALPATEKGSGRLELADWLTRRQNPLTARVMVNRIWQHHFGAGLVQTENDFGTRGKRPTDPLLLDWLASRFIESGWSVKAMHRMMMLSQTYRLSSDMNPAAYAADPEDNLLWRFRRQRLDAEEIRDAMMALGGNLDRTPGGPHPFPAAATWKFTQHAPFSAVYDTDRRSIYLMVQRIQRHPYLELFDAPDGNVCTARRDVTTVPTQALFMMNSAFMHEQAGKFAGRVLGAQADSARRLELAYEMALGRKPSVDDISQAMQFLDRYRQALASAGTPADQCEAQAWSALARTMFCGNEFMFVD